jgi:succinyl-diaminopimelate desuccinylase
MMSNAEQYAIELTQRLVRMNTVNPPGNGKAAALFLGDQLRGSGFDVAYHEFEPNRTSLVARYASNRAQDPLCFTGHLDTVPLGSAGWERDAHGGDIVDGRLYGRGSSDMKAGISAFVAAALEHVRRAPRAANLTLVLTASEETGCQGAHHLASTGALGRAGALIVAEPTANYPMIGHKGVLWLTARTRGVAAHGSTPDIGVNAIYRARRVLEKLEGYRFAIPTHTHLGPPTLSVGTMNSGSNINTVPDRAEVGIDIRTIPGMDGAALRDQLIDHLAPELTDLENLVDFEPIWTSPDAPWVRRVFDLLTPLLGARPQPRGASYFTDACALKTVYLDAPTVILGPGDPDQAHQTDEYCHVSRIAQAVEIYGALLRDWNCASNAAAH